MKMIAHPTADSLLPRPSCVKNWIKSSITIEYFGFDGGKTPNGDEAMDWVNHLRKATGKPMAAVNMQSSQQQLYQVQQQQSQQQLPNGASGSGSYFHKVVVPVVPAPQVTPVNYYQVATQASPSRSTTSLQQPYQPKPPVYQQPQPGPPPFSQPVKQQQHTSTILTTLQFNAKCKYNLF
eukprot:gene2961-3405_t